MQNEIVTSGKEYKVVLTPEKRTMTADGYDLVYIDAEIQDKDGNFCPTAMNLINFNYVGDPSVAEIVGVDNGNADSWERAKDYDGIDVTTAGNILKNNLKVLSNDMKNAAKNMKSYSTGIENLDVDDFTTQSDTFSLSLGNKIGGFISGIVTSYTTGLDKIGKAIMVPFTNNDENSNSNNR